MSELKELESFLRSDRANVRLEAVKIALGLSQDLEVRTQLSKDPKSFVNTLLNIGSGAISEEEAHTALSALVNFLSDDAIASSLCDRSVISSICEALQEKHLLGPPTIEHDLLMALTNLSRQAAATAMLLEQEIFLFRLLNYYGDPVKAVAGSDIKDTCEHIGHILVNVTTAEEGRRWLTSLDKAVWEMLSKHCRHSHRRPVILQVVKNLACDNDLVDNADFSQLQILPLLGRMLYPAPATLSALKKSVGQSWEGEVPAIIEGSAFGLVSDLQSRKLIAECLVGLLKHKNARAASREIHMYEIFRVWHILETDPELLKLNEDLVHLVHYSEAELEEQDRNGRAA